MHVIIKSYKLYHSNNWTLHAADKGHGLYVESKASHFTANFTQQ